VSRSTTIAILALGCALTGCVSDSAARSPVRASGERGPLVAALANATPAPRRWAAQLSTPLRFASCGNRGLDSLRDLACPSSGGNDSRDLVQLRDVAARIARADLDRLDADGLHAAALLDLITADSARNALDRPISYLEMISRTAPPDADVLADLSAAYLARAARTGDGADALRAVDAAARAVERDPRAPAARFDEALALQAVGLDGQADSAWTAYLAIDSTTRWADEARQRRERTKPVVELADAERSDDDLRSFAQRVPEQALVFAWDTLFADWSEATMKRDARLANDALRRAQVIGDVLASKGDSTTVDAVNAIRAAAPSSRKRLATAHAAYAAGDVAFRTNQYTHADSAFSVALAAEPHGALLGWIEFGRANNLLSLGRSDDSQSALARLLNRPAATRFPAIVGRIDWVLGVILSRHGQWTGGIDYAHRATALFARLGQRQNQATMIALEAEDRLHAGDNSAGLGGLVQGIRMSRGYVGSVSRHGALALLVKAASADGLAYAARAIDDEDAIGIERYATPISRATALVSRVGRLLAGHRMDLARETDRRLAEAIAPVPNSASRRHLEARRTLTQAELVMDADPRTARVLLDSAVAEFGSTKEVVLLSSALLERARAASMVGDASGSSADFSRALGLYEHSKRDFATEAASIRAESRSVVDSLVTSRVRAGDATGALDILDRWHSAFGPSDIHGPRASVATQPTLVEQLIGDTLFAWVKRDSAVHFTRTFVPHDALAATVDRVAVLLEHSTSQEAWRPELAQLYDWLIRPVASELGPAGSEVRIVPEAAAAGAPYAALFDGAHYFVERHAVIVADDVTPRLRDRRAHVSGHTVIVADPAQTAFAALPSLVFADSEALWVSRRYSHPLVLRGAEADSLHVSQALSGATLFHFAGHAVFDETRPERSALAVGAHGLTASAIAAMNLSRLDLAVLAACNVVRGAVRADGAANGLTDAFLAAGARGVIGATWSVDDAAARQLIERFYIEYASSGNPAAALRAAQRSVVTEPPSTWGAFRYAEQ